MRHDPCLAVHCPVSVPITCSEWSFPRARPWGRAAATQAIACSYKKGTGNRSSPSCTEQRRARPVLRGGRADRGSRGHGGGAGPRVTWHGGAGPRGGVAITPREPPKPGLTAGHAPPRLGRRATKRWSLLVTFHPSMAAPVGPVKFWRPGKALSGRPGTGGSGLTLAWAPRPGSWVGPAHLLAGLTSRAGRRWWAPGLWRPPWSSGGEGAGVRGSAPSLGGDSL